MRTLIGICLWFGIPPVLALVLARMGARHTMHRLQRWWAHRVHHYLNIQLDIEGLEHIDRTQTYIITPLHEGFMDIVLLLHLPLNMVFAARDELFAWRLLGVYLRRTGHIEVCPEQGRRSYRHLLRAAKEVIANGESLVIFPQGGLLGIETECSGGAFALARTLQCPILPIALTGTHRVWEYPYAPHLHYGQRVSMRILPPVSVEEIQTRSVEDVRLDIQQQLKRIALSGTMAPPRRFVPSRDGYWDGYAYRIDPHFADLAEEVAHHRARVALQKGSLAW